MASNLLRLTTFFFGFCLNILYLQAETVSVTQESCYKVNAPECSFAGNYNCSTDTCDCGTRYFGKKCECLVEGDHPYKFGCQAPNSTRVCSNRGSCICNICDCEYRENPNEIITGKWCECDNFSCDRHDGEICDGHGTCDCGRCVCTPPWTGEACECYGATNTCYPPYTENPQLCDGHGDCVCGSCQCHNTPEGRYTGRYCERCPNCTETCDELRPCVGCLMYHIGPYDEGTCINKCGDVLPEAVEVITADEEHDEFLCEGFDENDCRYAFVYKKFNETQYFVRATQERKCSAF